jgi:outer membrane murein-binding lipoprotein Lpp
MAFTVREFHDLVEIMETQPVWRAEMRRLILTDDILNLPQEIRALSETVRDLVEIGKRNEARFAHLETELAAANQRNEARFTRIESDIRELKTDVAVLKTDVAVLKTDVAVLKTDVAVLKTDVAGLKTDVAVLKTDVADLKGASLESQVRERPFVYLSRFARRLRLVDDAELGRLVEDALDQGRVSEAEAEDLKLIDVVARGQTREPHAELYLAGEVSSVVNQYDLTRAVTRAALLQKATGVRTLPIVLGKIIGDELRTQAEAAEAGWVLLPA